ncbi:MAG: hypothetical protein IJ871_07455 [Ruminococcus sp.]|nr:hypothetical protein [Ruminococcus sp.]
MTYTTTKVQALKSYPTYQFYAQADSRSVDTDSVFKICILEALKWIRSRLQDNSDLPQVFSAPEPEQYASFTLDELSSFSYNSGVQIDVIYIDTLGVWSFRISEPDPGANHGTEQERPAVNGRTFTTEIAFRKQSDCVGIGVRTICSEPSDNNVDCEVFRPRVVKALIDNPNLHLMQGGSVIDGTPLEIRSKNDLELFFDIFLDEARSMPIIIAADSKTKTVKIVDIECTPMDIKPGIDSYSLSGLARQNDPMKLTIIADLKDYKTNIIPESRTKKQKAKPSAEPKVSAKKLPVFDYGRLARTLAGYAFVAFAEERFFKQIGNRLGTVVEHGDIIVISGKQISERHRYSSYSSDMEAFYKTFRTAVIDMSKRSAYSFGEVLFYSDAKLKEYHTKRHQTDSLEETCNIYRMELGELRAQVKALSQQQTDMQQTAASLRAAQKKIESLTNELESEKEKNKALAEEFVNKEAAYRRSSEILEHYKQQLDVAAGFPTDCKNVCDWAANAFSNDLIISSRAQSEMRKYSGALDIASLCDGLVFLAAYARYRRQEITEETLSLYAQRNNWDIQGCGKEAMKLHKTDYFLTFGGKQYLLDQHIKHGIKSEELIRIYFCWDEAERKVLIGSMPGHLATVKNGT